MHAVELATISADPLGLLVAFGAGMLSFLSPCVLPLVPGYVSMVSGLSAAELENVERRDLRPLLIGMGAFVLGFTVVFTALGATVSALGKELAHHARAFEIASGIVIAILGLWLAGIGTPSLFHRERRFHPLPSRLGPWGPLVMGMAFAFGWTPCIGPVLGGVLTLSADKATLTSGVALLICYSLGLGVPFVATGLAFGRLTAVMAKVRRRLWLVDLIAGIGLIVFGALLVSDQLHWVSSLVADLLRRLGLGRLAVS
jgi:cytochrome c-type biogenesis protein